MDFTIVLQGRVSEACLENLVHYRSVAKIVLSCFRDQFSAIPQALLDACDKVVLSDPAVGDAYNAQNVYLQTISTLTGLGLVDTPFAIKLRADETFADLTPILDSVRENPDKFTTINYIFRKLTFCEYHPSDHILAGRTEALTAGFALLRRRLTAHEYRIDEYDNYGRAAEAWITTCLLKARGCRIARENARQNMLSHFCMVPVQKLQPFVLAYNSDKKLFRDVDSIFAHATERNWSNFYLFDRMEDYLDA